MGGSTMDADRAQAAEDFMKWIESSHETSVAAHGRTECPGSTSRLLGDGLA